MSLPAGELALLRRDAEAMLSDTCVVTHREETPDDYGGYTLTETSEESLCYVTASNAMLSVSEQEQGGPVLSSVPYTVRLPITVSVDPNDRIEHQGRTLEVVAVLGPHTNELIRRVACRAVGG